MKSILLLLPVMMIAGAAAAQHGHYGAPLGRQPKPITVGGADRVPVAAGHLRIRCENRPRGRCRIRRQYRGATRSAAIRIEASDPIQGE
jgi:hypothetical protein